MGGRVSEHHCLFCLTAYHMLFFSLREMFGPKYPKTLSVHAEKAPHARAGGEQTSAV